MASQSQQIQTLTSALAQQADTWRRHLDNDDSIGKQQTGLLARICRSVAKSDVDRMSCELTGR